MSRIASRFAELKQAGRSALIPFVTAGDPNPQVTVPLMHAMVAAGADLIELGVPFSDPMADGPTIQAAFQRALAHPFSIKSVLGLVRNIRTYSQVPVILFGYYNPFLQYGLEALCKDAREAGADGFLVVDMPPEEAGPMQQAAGQYGLDLIFLLAPTSTEERIRQVCKAGSGFVYFVSVTGVTGARDSLDDTLSGYIDKIRQHTDLPLGIGFGISRPEQVSEVAGYADAVIVGSAIIKVIEASAGEPDMLSRVGEFVKSLKNATRI